MDFECQYQKHSKPMKKVQFTKSTMIIPHFTEISKRLLQHPRVLSNKNSSNSIKYCRVATMGSDAEKYEQDKVPFRSDLSIPLFPLDLIKEDGKPKSLRLHSNYGHDNLYFIPNCLTTDKISGYSTHDADILQWYFIPLDLDDYKGPRIDYIKQFCSLIWKTSEDRYSALLPIIHPDDTDCALDVSCFTAVSKSLIDTLGVDKGTFNPSRLLRWPGAFNGRKNYQGRVVKAREYTDLIKSEDFCSMAEHIERMNHLEETYKEEVEGDGSGRAIKIVRKPSAVHKINLSYAKALTCIRRGWRIKGVHKGNQDYHMVKWCGEIASDVVKGIMNRDTAVGLLDLLQRFALEEEFKGVEPKYIKKLDEFIQRDRKRKEGK